MVAPPSAPVPKRRASTGRRALTIVLVLILGSVAVGALAGPKLTDNSLVVPTAAPTRYTPIPKLSSRPAGWVTYRADQLILPPAEFAMPGYTVILDKSDPPSFSGSGWTRQWASQNGAYWFVETFVHVFDTRLARESIAGATCDWTFQNGTAKAYEITADVIGDGAKACRYELPGTFANWTVYITGFRNVEVIVGVEPALTSDADALDRAIQVASQQLAIVDRVSPPASGVAYTARPYLPPTVQPQPTYLPTPVPSNGGGSGNGYYWANWACTSGQCANVMGAYKGSAGPFCAKPPCETWKAQYMAGATCDLTEMHPEYVRPGTSPCQG